MRTVPGCLPSSRPTSSELRPRGCAARAPRGRRGRGARRPCARPPLGAGDGVVLRPALGSGSILRHEPQRSPAATRVLVDDVAGDAEEPGVETAALPREAVDAVEGPGHRLAHDVLGGPVVEQAAAGEPEQGAVRPSIQRLPGVGVTARRLRDEVAQLLIRRRSRSSSHRCHDVRAPSGLRRLEAADGATRGRPIRDSRRSALRRRDGDVDDGLVERADLGGCDPPAGRRRTAPSSRRPWRSTPAR